MNSKVLINNWKNPLDRAGIKHHSQWPDFVALLENLNERFSEVIPVEKWLQIHDENKESLLYHLFLKNCYHLVKHIFENFIKLSPSFEKENSDQWWWLATIIENDCHRLFKDFFGQQLHDDIVQNLEVDEVPQYSTDRVCQAYDRGQVAEFLSDINNLTKIYDSPEGQTYDLLYVMLFINQYGSLVREYIENMLIQDQHQEMWSMDWLMFSAPCPTGQYPCVPRPPEINFCLERFGKEKTQTLVFELLSLSKKVVDATMPSSSKLIVPMEEIVALLDFDFDFKNNISLLAPYITGVDIHLYCVARGIITPGNASELIRVPELKTLAHYHYLNATCNEKDPSRKRKL